MISLTSRPICTAVTPDGHTNNPSRGVPSAARDVRTDFIWRCKPDLTITFVNSALSTLLGVIPNALVGQPLYAMSGVLPSCMAEAIANLSLQNPVIDVADNVPVAAAGSGIDWTCHAFFNDRGHVAGIQATGRSRNCMDALQADVRLNEARLRDFAEVGSDWFWETDAQDRMTYLSRSWEQHSFLTRGEVYGLQISDYWQRMGLNAAECQPALEEVRRRSPEFEFERTQQGRDGSVRQMQIRARAFYDAAGAFAGYRGIGFDVTRERRAEAELRQAKETAEYANRAKSDFLANMSHELRTPLNSVLGFSELMKDELMGPIGSSRYRHYAESIHLSAAHLLEIINDILDLSKVENGSQELREEKVDLQQVIHTCQRIITPRAAEADLSIEIGSTRGLPHVWADKTILNQILLNLLTNAVKFTPSGGSISFRVKHEENGGVSFLVKDTGIGIAEADRERVLEPFTQVAPADSRGHRGTGLGLSLTKSLVELHDGTLTIESALGAGTTATVLLPATRVAVGQAA